MLLAPVVAALVLLLTGAAHLEAQAVTRPTAARDLPRGTVLQAEDIAFGEGADRDAAPLGWVTRRVVSEGEVLRPPTVAPHQVVRSGDDVQVVWSSGGLELRIAGRALNSAAVGERVKVRSDGSRRFEGVATATGVVHLDSPGT